MVALENTQKNVTAVGIVNSFSVHDFDWALCLISGNIMVKSM